MGEWQEVTVGDVAASTRNALVGGPFGSDLVSRDYVATGVPVIRGQNMGNRWVSGDFVFVTEGKADSLSANTARPGDIVFTQRGTLGQVSLVPEQPFERYVVSQSQMKLTVNSDLADSRFLYYVFSGAAQREYIRQNAIQTGVPHTNLGILRATPIPLPPIDEQRAIAGILGALDDRMELNRRLGETLEAMARALFKSWFVDFDPVRAKAEGRDTGLPREIAELFPDSFEESELGEIPVGWSLGAFSDIAKHPRRTVQPSQIQSGTPYIALEHMPKRCIALATWDTADQIESNKAVFAKGEILFGKLRPYFHKVGVAPVDGVCSTDVVVVAPTAQHWFGLVLGHAMSDAFVRHTNAGASGTKMPRTSWADMARYGIVVPSEPVADLFSRHVQGAVSRIVSGIHESRTLAALRDTLLPKLISGELRVRDAERLIEAATA